MAVGWGVLGTGRHVHRTLPSMRAAEGGALSAICSRDLARAREMAGEFGFARAYDSYETMLRDDSVEAVYICTPNSLHAQHTLQAAQAGKHVLVEKPMALTSPDAEAMIEACEAANVRLGVGFHLRHHQVQKDAKQAIDEGRIGKPFMYDLRWIAPGGHWEGWRQSPVLAGALVMMARGVHLIDLVRYLSGREVEEVTAMTDSQRPGHQMDDTVLATLRMGDDVFATLFATRRAAEAKNGYSVYGTAGRLEATDSFIYGTGELALALGGVESETGYSGQSPYQEEIAAFNRAVREGTPFEASGQDGLMVVRATVALLESAQTGRAVKP